jgi:hypothetical protein
LAAEIYVPTLIISGQSSWNRTKVASTLPNRVIMGNSFFLATAGEVHLSSIQYLLEKQLIQIIEPEYSILFFKAKTTLSKYPYQFNTIIRMNTNHIDIIIGAGLSGIGAACHLSRKIRKPMLF